MATTQKKNLTRRGTPQRGASKREARLEFRLSREAKERIEKAALASGQSVSDFAASTLLREAGTVLASHHVTVLSERDWNTFSELLQNPPAPNHALKAAAARYQQHAQHQDETTVFNDAVLQGDFADDPH